MPGSCTGGEIQPSGAVFYEGGRNGGGADGSAGDQQPKDGGAGAAGKEHFGGFLPGSQPGRAYGYRADHNLRKPEGSLCGKAL